MTHRSRRPIYKDPRRAPQQLPALPRCKASIYALRTRRPRSAISRRHTSIASITARCRCRLFPMARFRSAILRVRSSARLRKTSAMLTDNFLNPYGRPYDLHDHIPRKGLAAIGDLTHHQILLVEKPRIEFACDTDPKQFANTRVRGFDMLAAQKIPLIAYHSPAGRLLPCRVSR